MQRIRLSFRSSALARRRVLLIAGAVCITIATVMFATSGRFSLATIAAQCGLPAPDVRWATSTAGIHEFLVACGDSGRSAYRDLQLLDLVYPAAIGLFMASALAYLLPRAFSGRHRTLGALTALPLAAAAFDYLENVGAWIVLARYPEPAPWAAWLFSVASPAKQALSWASWLLVVAALLGATVAGLRTRWTGTDDGDLPPPLVP
jgi:hypothetical protein